MLGRVIAISVASLLSAAVWAAEVSEAPVVEAQAAQSSMLALNEAPVQQQYVQRNDEGGASNSEQSSPLLLNKIESLEQDVKQLRGQLEVQAHDLKLLNEQQQSFYKDLDTRLSKLSEAKGAAKAATAEPAVDKKTAEKEAKPAAAVSSNAGNGEASYTAAYNLVKEKQYTQAISAMEAFLVAYPSSPYLANAHYWLGELYLMQGHVDQALQAFNTVVTQYPNSNKAAGAQLKIGFVHFDRGEWKTARAALEKVTKTYPDTSLARLAKARMQAMDQRGL